MIKKLFVIFSIIGLLTACGGNDEEAGKDKGGATQEQKKGEPTKVRGDFTTAEELAQMDFDSKNFSWNDIYLSEQTFTELLYNLTEPDDQGEVVLERAELVEWDTVELVINNSEGDSLKNSLQAVYLDAIVRQFYKHSEFYDGEEPHIRVLDLDGLVIAENKEPIKLEDEKKKEKDKK